MRIFASYDGIASHRITQHRCSLPLAQGPAILFNLVTMEWAVISYEFCSSLRWALDPDA